MIALAVLGLLGAGFVGMAVLTVHDVLLRPGFRRLAFRNITRRPGEAALVVVGCMLGTAIITGAFLVGDTFEASLQDRGRRTLGPIDVAASVRGLDSFAAFDAAATAVDLPDTDGVLSTVTATAAVSDAVADGRRAEPHAGLLEVDFDAARSFGGDPAATGLAEAGPTPAGNEAVVNENLADTLEVGIGDGIVVHAYGQAWPLTVSGVVDEVGLAGSTDVFVAPGTIAHLAASSTIADALAPNRNLYVSGTGGVFSGVVHSEALEAGLTEAFASVDGVDVQPYKQDLLDNAAREGDGFRQLFLGIGSFSVLVGILLLVNLFVMLAEERKSELGMVRAVGMKRNHLLRVFSIEGATYAVAAAITGGLAGIGVGWVIAQVTEGILTADQPEFAIVFELDAGSVVTGMVIGLVISLVTVWATSVRIARLNVIRAIRGLPEPPSDRGRRRTLVLAGVGVLAGALLTMTGLSGRDAIPALVGPPVVVMSLVPLARRWAGWRAAVIGAGVASIAWGVGIFSLLPEVTDGADIPVFVVQGVVLVGSAVVVASALDGAWTRLSTALVGGGRGLAARLALAYPLARRTRTGLLLAMFSLTIFTMTFMAVVGSIFEQQAGDFANRDRGGFDLAVFSNPANPVSFDALDGAEDVALAAPLTKAWPDFTAEGLDEPVWWSATGFGPQLVEGGPPVLSSWAPEYASSDAVFAAVLADPDLVIVPDRFLSLEVGPSGGLIELGDTIVMHDRDSDASRSLRVVGMTDADFVGNGAMVGHAVLEDLLGDDAIGGGFYVKVADGIDPVDLAARLDGRFLANGVESISFVDRVEAELAEQSGFFSLLEGYLGLGLLIGVAGLGVVMVRSVRERRREVGVLRALGVDARAVRTTFLLEAAFVSVQGAAIGVGLGMVAAYQLLTNSATFGDTPLPFSVPGGLVFGIFAVPVLASLIATATPAVQAARIRPAAALRIAD